MSPSGTCKHIETKPQINLRTKQNTEQVNIIFIKTFDGYKNIWKKPCFHETPQKIIQNKCDTIKLKKNQFVFNFCHMDKYFQAALAKWNN